MAAASGAGEKTGATLFLETKNRIVEQYMYDHLLGEDPAEHAQFVVGDFDGRLAKCTAAALPARLTVVPLYPTHRHHHPDQQQQED